MSDRLKFVTSFQAIDVATGMLEKYIGPTIEAISFSDAQSIVELKRWPWIKVEGQIISNHVLAPAEKFRLWN